MRLAKYIARSGYCSRRNASRLIEAGRVQVNGEVADHITFVKAGDLVMIENQMIKPLQQRLFVAYHKPVGVDCNFNENDPTSLVHHIKGLTRLFAVGRLDKDSSGLLILTNDGECCHRLLSPEFKQPKTYRVRVRASFEREQVNKQDLDDDFVTALSAGVLVDGQLTLPCDVKLLSDEMFEITLVQGLNRQIRKMAKSQGFQVVTLERTHFANICLADLQVGQQRLLTSAEVEEIMCLCALTKSL